MYQIEYIINLKIPDMKKLFTFLIVLLALATNVSAQKTIVRFQDTQARLLDVMTNAYVKPLTVELKILSETRVSDIIPLTMQQVAEMDSKLENIRSYAVYRSSQLHNCDVIVAATFNVRTNAAGDGYEVNIIGYPANFVNWKTATKEDLEWIKMEKMGSVQERDKEEEEKTAPVKK